MSSRDLFPIHGAWSIYGMAYVNVRVSRRLKEELGWAIDKQLRLIIDKMLFKTVIPLRI